MKTQRAVFMVLLAGLCWGGMGILVRTLQAAGMGSFDITFIRCLFTPAILLLVILITDRSKLRVRIRDLWIFALSALITVIIFNFCYLSAVRTLSLAVAIMLSYTSPAFVILFSALLFRERITPRKILSLLLMISGMVFVTGLIGSSLTVTLAGFFFGIGASVTGAMIPIFNKAAVGRGYTGLTITFYTYLIALCGAFFLADRANSLRVVFGSGRTFLAALGISLLNTVVPFLLVAAALKTLDAGRAAILGSVEPVVATLISVFFYKEPITGLMVLGIALVLTGIALCSVEPAYDIILKRPMEEAEEGKDQL